MILTARNHDFWVPLKTCDVQIQSKSGEYRWFHARGQALWVETDQATRMSGSITDITDRKQAEIELRGAYTEIEQLKKLGIKKPKPQ